MTEKRSWFVWDAEYPEHGCTVVRAESERRALVLARRDILASGEEPPELQASKASPTELRAWEKSA